MYDLIQSVCKQMVSVLFFVFIVTMVEIEDTVKLTESEGHYSEIQKINSGRQVKILRFIMFIFLSYQFEPNMISVLKKHRRFIFDMALLNE